MQLTEQTAAEKAKNPEEMIAFLVAENHKIQDELSTKEKIINDLSAQIQWFKEQIKLSQYHRFAQKSEQLKQAEQVEILSFFDEPTFSSEEPQEPAGQSAAQDEIKEETITVPEHQRKKPGRKPLPKELPREVIEHKLPENQQICNCCGEKLTAFGKDTSERLKHIPEQFIIEEHVRYKYACKNQCEKSIKMAELPKAAIPKSIASEELLAHVIVSKYVDHLPLYRQEKIYGRAGIDIDRTNLSNWIFKCADLFEPMVNIFKTSIRQGNYTNADETPVKLLTENGEINTSQSYMFVYIGGDREAPNILYNYQPTRSGASVEKILENFKGHLQTDAFSGYDRFEKDPHITLVGCWAHARRKYYEITKITKNPGLAQEGLNFITRLYKVEKGFTKEDSLAFIQRIRQEKSKSILGEMELWLKKNLPKTPPQGLIAKAMAYTHNNWKALTEYIHDGKLAIDNNIAENAIRPFALGRKNWLFCGNEKGAKASAMMYSIIETCKANKIRPENYLLYLLKTLPYVDKHNPNEYQKHTPQVYKKQLALSTETDS